MLAGTEFGAPHFVFWEADFAWRSRSCSFAPAKLSNPSPSSWAHQFFSSFRPFWRSKLRFDDPFLWQIRGANCSGRPSIGRHRRSWLWLRLFLLLFVCKPRSTFLCQCFHFGNPGVHFVTVLFRASSHESTKFHKFLADSRCLFLFLGFPQSLDSFWPRSFWWCLRGAAWVCLRIGASIRYWILRAKPAASGYRFTASSARLAIRAFPWAHSLFLRHW